jgi:hypothetical protein
MHQMSISTNHAQANKDGNPKQDTKTVKEPIKSKHCAMKLMHEEDNPSF